ncbi:response regulator [Agromyces marinus]|uniref:DNA-binding response regulator n=1 Tax=Agromyces marinus TaxID=1389020 RepID=A0ABM8H4C1_9MICO|nr:response regulator transcription factor [Agromyces marinus]UIP59375.1 Transcriptional regulatory protein LnrK [Agromyces marinus]BDZ55585.1 DNA-binding response regulator [Agromyces marinus]
MTGGDGARTRVAIVDDQELVRAGFRLILERAGFDIVAEAADGEEAVARVAETLPDVVLMDMRMPVLDGVEATRRITARPEAPRVLALTTFDLDDLVFGAVRAGASGFLLKDVSPDDLVHGVRVVARGEAMLAPAVTARLLERFAAAERGDASHPEATARLAGLSERESDIARLVARGLSNAEIASRLFLSESTVKTYVSRLLTRLDARDRVQVAVLAYEGGLVRVGEADA